MNEEEKDDYVTLKWGTLKAWKIQNPETFALLQEYFGEGVSASAMAQRDSSIQKKLLCDIIEQIGNPVYMDWDGEYVSVEDAKKYVMEYGN